MLNVRLLALTLSLVFVFLPLFGCDNAAQPSRPPMDNARVQQIAQGWQQQGVLSQQDYTRAVGILTAIQKTGRISDADLDWLLALLKQPTRDPVAVHLLVMSLIINLDAVTEAQSAKINSALEPFQESNVPVENKMAALALDNVRRNTQSAGFPWVIVLLVVVGAGGGAALYMRQRQKA